MPVYERQQMLEKISPSHFRMKLLLMTLDSLFIGEETMVGMFLKMVLNWIIEMLYHTICICSKNTTHISMSNGVTNQT